MIENNTVEIRATDGSVWVYFKEKIQWALIKEPSEEIKKKVSQIHILADFFPKE